MTANPNSDGSASSTPEARDALAIVRRFAVSLDEEDDATTRALLDGACVDRLRGEVVDGPDAIVASYRGNGDTAARVFDRITYGSIVRADGTDRCVITFSDHVVHGGRRLDHVCERHVLLGTRGTIIRIDHHDLPGERERIEAFRASFGL